MLFALVIKLHRPCDCCEQDLVQKAAEAERKRLRAEQRVKRALDDKFPTADDVPDEVLRRCHLPCAAACNCCWLKFLGKILCEMCQKCIEELIY